MGATHAVLIGIETYQKQGISSVQFAQADAAAMKDVLVQHFGVHAENITLWLDSDATRSQFENDLPYTIRQLSPGDRFIFFYAGHGFYANGTNRLTTWDTHPSNLAGTTVSLEEVLLKPLKDRPGVDSLVFIDACAADLKTSAEQSRDIVSDLTPTEFEALVRSTDHAAAFFACSPNEKAYPSDALMHGIWTYHLIQALQGDAEGALDRDRFITGESLKNYLAVAVPAYIRANTKIQAAQRPYAILSSNGPFSIRQVLPSDSAKFAILTASDAAEVLRRMTAMPSNNAVPQQKRKHNIVFLNAEVVKLAYSGPGYSERNDGKHSFSEVVGISTGDMVGLVARFRNEAVYGEDVPAVHGVRAHLKLFDRNGKEIGTGFSSAQWLGWPNDTFDLTPNGRGGSVIVCRGGKKTKPLVMWKAHDIAERVRDRNLELTDGYPSRAEITLMDSDHRPLLQPVVLDITESAGGLSVSGR